MPKFAFIYRGANPPGTPEEGQAHMQKWKAWADSLGDAYIYPGMPFSQTVRVDANGIEQWAGDVPLNGVSVVEVATCEDAGAMAASCPHLQLGGDIIVAEGVDMEM